MLQLEACKIDLDRERVHVGDEQLKLTPTEAALLRYVSARPDEDLSREQLLTECWGYRTTNSRTVDTTMKQLRKKVERDPKDPRHLRTVYGVGYRFVPLEVTAEVEVPLVGRNDERTAVAQALDEHRLVTLLGAGGIGKTTIARAVLSDFDGPAWFVSLEGVTEPAALLAKSTDAVGLSVDDTEQLAQRLMPEGRCLLLYDNAEQCTEALAAFVNTLLDTNPQLVVLVTSRLRIDVEREHVVPVGPLQADQATELFRRHCQTAASDDEIGELVAAVEGSPLLVELAAARARLLSVSEVLERLDEPLATLAGGPRDRPQRQQSMRGNIDWSWGLLSPVERHGWMAASCFASTFSAADFETVAPQGGLNTLRTLVDTQVVRRTGRGRFEQPAALRAFGLEKLHEADEADVFFARHADRILDIVKPEPTGPILLDWLDTARRYAADLRLVATRVGGDRASLAWIALARSGGLASEERDAVAELLMASETPDVWFYGFAVYTDKLNRRNPLRVYREVCAVLDQRDDLSDYLRGRLCLVAISSALMSDQTDTLRQHLEQADKLLTPHRYWNLRIHQAVVAMEDGDLDLAQAYVEEARRWVGDDIRGALSVDLRVGNGFMEDEDYEEAVRCFQAAAQSARRLRHGVLELSARIRLCEAVWHLGELEAALEQCDPVEDLAVGLQSTVVLAWVHLLRAGIRAELGKPAFLPTLPDEVADDARQYKALIGMVMASMKGNEADFEAAAALATRYEGASTPRMAEGGRTMIAARRGQQVDAAKSAWARAARMWLEASR